MVEWNAKVVQMNEKPRFRLRFVSRSVVEVTPKMAEAWLRNNPHNRPLNEEKVAALASKMRSGEWEERIRGSRTVEVLDSGRLLNGQHRLSAVVRVGVAVRMCVTVYKKIKE